MAQLKITIPAGMFSLPDSALAAGENVSDDLLVKLNHMTKSGIAKTEFFYMGIYGPGDTVPTPVSPVDGYSYKIEECLFVLSEASGDSPLPGYIAGQAAFPSLQTGLPGPLICTPFRFSIDALSATLRLQQYAQNGSNDFGTAHVWVIGQRAGSAISKLLPSSSVFAQPVSDPGAAGGNPGDYAIPRYGPGGAWTGY